MDQETVDATFESVIRSYARQVRVPGFRPGKAPRGVIVKRIGEEALAEEAREAIIEASYPAAIREHELQAVHAHAHGDNPAEGQAFEYELHVELYPDFTIPDPDSVSIEAAPEAITDERIQETITNLKRENATQVPVDRPVEAGDVVHIETIGDDDEAKEGTSMPIDLETVNPHLGNQLLGKNLGDVFDLELEEPHVHEGEDEERAITTRIRVADVKAKEFPEEGDEFASTMGFESWDDVLTAIRSTLEDQEKQRAGEAQREEFVEKLLEGTTVELPPYLVNRRKLNLLESLARDLRRQGMEMDAYLAKLDADGKRRSSRPNSRRAQRKASSVTWCSKNCWNFVPRRSATTNSAAQCGTWRSARARTRPPSVTNTVRNGS